MTSQSSSFTGPLGGHCVVSRDLYVQTEFHTTRGCTSSKITCTGHFTTTGGDDLTPADSNSNLSHQSTEAKG